MSAIAVVSNCVEGLLEHASKSISSIPSTLLSGPIFTCTYKSCGFENHVTYVLKNILFPSACNNSTKFMNNFLYGNLVTYLYYQLTCITSRFSHGPVSRKLLKTMKLEQHLKACLILLMHSLHTLSFYLCLKQMATGYVTTLS